MSRVDWSSFFFFNDTATTEIYTLSLHDALPICDRVGRSDEDPSAHRHFVEARGLLGVVRTRVTRSFGHQIEPGPVLGEHARSEEHTSELQSPCNLVCRLLLEKKKKVADLPMLAL